MEAPRLHRHLAPLLLGALLIAAPHGAPAEESLPTGLEIAKRINARDDGQAVSSKLEMELIDRRGKKRERTTRSFRKHFGGERRTAIFFESPRNIKDTAFLTYDYPESDREDDQWLFLPAMRKVRRISASNRGDSFLGTDFSYEDIKKGSKVEIDDHEWKMLGEEEVDGAPCYKVEAVPTDEALAKELGYGKRVLWVDRKLWMPRKSAYWDVRGNPLKTVQVREIREVQGIWTAHLLEAENHKTGHRTIFRLSEVDYRSGVDDDLFTRRSLRRGL